MGQYVVRIEMECDITVEATSVQEAENKARQLIVSQYGGATDIYNIAVIEAPFEAEKGLKK